MCECFSTKSILKNISHFYITISMSTYQIKKILPLHFLILILTYSYAFCSLIHLDGFYFFEMQHNVVIHGKFKKFLSDFIMIGYLLCKLSII